MVRFLADLDYDFTDISNGRSLAREPEALRRTINVGAGINTLLTPRRKVA